MNGVVSTGKTADKSEVGVNDSKFSGHEQQKM